jgi:hypothetical protein
MNEQGTTPPQIDSLLLPYLRARSEVEVDVSLTELLTEHAEPIIKGIVRNKLNVTLSSSDGRLENQEALEVESDCLAALLTELNELKSPASEKAINNFRSYVAVITFHACYKYLRRKNPQRGQLKDKLRYLLNSRNAFSLWQTGEQEWVCGLSEWQNHERQVVRSGQLLQLVNSSPQGLHKAITGGTSIEQMKLEELLPAVLACAGKPVEFDELVNAVAELQNVKLRSDKGDASEEESEKQLASIPDPRPDAAALTDQRFYLQKLWTEIGQLPLRQRVALLLNLKDAQGRGMISMFPLTGIATMPQIAAALEIPTEKFASLWNDLPWEDAAIAEHLNCTRQQVVNLRKCARERLARRMKGF